MSSREREGVRQVGRVCASVHRLLMAIVVAVLATALVAGAALADGWPPSPPG